MSGLDRRGRGTEASLPREPQTQQRRDPKPGSVGAWSPEHSKIVTMSEARFIADVMVGRLARWLRVLGFDVAYSNKYEDREIIRIAESEERVILTRDVALAARPGRAQCIFVESGDYERQIRQVIDAFSLREFAMFSRCLECNTRLEQVDRDAVFERVPPYVYMTQQRFAVCPSCRRIYWHGTHTGKMLERLGFS